MSHTLLIKLKQHSPLIHFEYKKDKSNPNKDATLRATEVKSRLDKFILESQAEPPKHWLVGKGKSLNRLALDYKLSIIGHGEAQEKTFVTNKPRLNKDPNTLIGPYFGNAKGIEWADGLTLAFSSFEPDVLNAIYQHIVPFFVRYNFGQRQSKGFGSFTVSHVNGRRVSGYTEGRPFGADDAERILRQQFGTVYRLDQSQYRQKNDEIIDDFERKNSEHDETELDELLRYEIINNEYQLLKSGRSARASGGYKKSKLFTYFVEWPDRIRWEKRRIKQKIKEIPESPHRPALLEERKPIDFNPDKSQNQRHNADSTDKRYYNDYEDSHLDPDSYRYIRALLGLAETNEYLTNSDDKKDKYTIKIKHITGKIQRLASPILFKLIDDSVYLIPQDIDPRIFDQPFTFSINHTKYPISDCSFELHTPKESEFNLIGFLDTALDHTIWKKIG